MNLNNNDDYNNPDRLIIAQKYLTLAIIKFGKLLNDLKLYQNCALKVINNNPYLCY